MIPSFPLSTLLGEQAAAFRNSKLLGILRRLNKLAQSMEPTKNPVIHPGDRREYYFEERCFITELLNEPEVPGISVARARVEPGVTTVLHQLRGTELYYLLSGEGHVEVGDYRGAVGAGDLVRILPQQPQRITNTGKEDLIFLAICAPRFQPEDYSAG